MRGIGQLIVLSKSTFLAPSKVTVSQAAGVARGPRRYLGKTKSQWLDKLMRSNANICATISLSFFPICAYYTYRYWSVIKPARELLEAKEREELLAEGKSTA
jgi:predicted metallo-beta-lactamase superfamily hydrolase